MQSIRLKLPDKVKEAAKQVAARLRTDDIGIVMDLICLVHLRGNGIPTDDRLKAIASRQTKMSKDERDMLLLVLRRRIVTLKKLVSMQLFMMMVDEKQLSIVDKVEQLLIALMSAGRKQQQSQCMSCPHLASCGFGTKYGQHVTDISTVVDPSEFSNTHPDCPAKPSLDLIHALDQAVTMLSQAGGPNAAQLQSSSTNNTGGYFGQQGGQGFMSGANATLLIGASQPHGQPLDLDPEPADTENFTVVGKAPAATGNGKYHTATYGKGQNFQLATQIIKDIGASQLCLFELGRTLDQLLASKAKGHYSPSSKLEKRSTQRHIESIGELTKAKSHHLADDDRVDAMIATKQLPVKQNLKREERPNVLYVLLDVSVSMREPLGSFNFLKGVRLTKAAMAALLTISLSKRVEEDNGVLMQRQFDNGPSALFTADSPVKFQTHRSMVSVCGFNGSGTSVVAAVDRAIKDIHAADSKSMLNKAEILLITDGEDYDLASHVARFRSDLGKIVLNTLDLSGGTQKVLKDLSDVYLAPQPGSTRLKDLVSLVNVTKKSSV